MFLLLLLLLFKRFGHFINYNNFPGLIIWHFVFS